MSTLGLFFLKHNFKDNQQIYEKFKSTCGYLGYALVLRFSIKLIYRLYRIFFRDLIKIDKYKKDSYTFPNQIHFIQQKNINYVVINLSFYNLENSKGEEIIELVKKHLLKGFKIVFVCNKIFKNKVKEFVNLNFNQEINKIKFVSFDPVWNEESFRNKLQKKLHVFNQSGKKISIFINILCKRKENFSTEIKSSYINNQIILFKICIQEMILNKGKSLIVCLDIKDNSCLNIFSFDTYQIKKLLKILRYEYYPKIDILSIPHFSNKLNSIKYYLKKILKN